MLLAIVDLLAVVTLGLVAASALALATGAQIPDALEKFLASAGLSEPSLTQVGAIAAVACLAMMFKSIFSFVLSRQALNVLAACQAKLSAEVMASLGRSSWLDVRARSSQELATSLTQGMNALVLGVAGQGFLAVIEIGTLGILVIGLAILEPEITAIASLYLGGVAVLLHRSVAHRSSVLGTEATRLHILSMEAVQEFVAIHREAVLRGADVSMVSAFSELRRRAAANQVGLQMSAQVSKYALEIALVVGAALLAVLQLWLAGPEQAVSTSVVFLIAASRILPALMRLQAAVVTLRLNRGMAEETLQLEREVLAAPPRSALNNLGVGTRSNPQEAAVVFDEVTYTYPESSGPAIRNISFTLNVGESLAIVGPSGAGKSTLINLLLGLCPPTHGRVTVCGSPPDKLFRSRPGSLAYVPQTTQMLNGSVLENLTLRKGEEAADEDRAWLLLDTVGLSELVRSRGGLRTPVGEGGLTLSGGQRQRLGIARALWTDPSLLVLDEATSALDAESEALLSQNLDRLILGKTLVVIAHRLVTVQHLDRTAFLSAGQLVGIGNFNDLRSRLPQFDLHAALSGLQR